MKKILILGLLLCLLLTACSSRKPYSPEFDLGVIQSTGTKNKSIITFYKNDFTEVSSMALPYGSMDYVGFIEPIVQKNHLFVIPKGLSTKKDLGIVLDIDLTDGSNKKVEFDRINITSIQVTDEYIFAASNFNQTVYLDRYQRQNKTTDTVKLNDWMVLNVGVHNGQLLATGLEMSESNSGTMSIFRTN